ncbi:MAG: peptide-binding protein [Pseudomonadota bacterium]
MKSVRIAALVWTALAIAAACSSCDWRVTRDPDVLADSLPADPPTLNPILATEVTAGAINKYVYESLLDLDNRTLEFKPKLARRWEVSPDHLSYTFWLRGGVQWHDGEPFTVDDVIYSFERIRDPKVDAAPLRNYFRDVKRIEKVGNDAVRFLYARPYFRALEMLGGMTIIPRHVFGDGADFNSHMAGREPIGTGPFRFAGWKTGREIRLERFDGYWGDAPAFKGIVYRIIPDQMSAFQLLKKGALDIGSLRAIQWVRQTESPAFGEKFAKHRYFLPNCSFIGWNMGRPLFSDRRVRIAMTMLVNRQEILKQALFGQGEVIAGDFYRFGPDYDASLQPYPYDPKEAARLLDEAGWIDHDDDGVRDHDGVPFRFTILSPAGGQLGRSLSLFLREELSKVGIVADIQQLEWGTMLELIGRRDFDAAIFGRSMPLNHDPYQVWHSTQVAEGSNFVGFKDKRADRLMEQARMEFDPKRRSAFYREFQRIVQREEPYTFLFTNPSLVAVAKRFENVRDYRLGLDALEWKVGPWPILTEW